LDANRPSLLCDGLAASRHGFGDRRSYWCPLASVEQRHHAGPHRRAAWVHVAIGPTHDLFNLGSDIKTAGSRREPCRLAQTPVQRYLPGLLKRIEEGEIDPSFVITHRAPLEDGPELYKTFRDKKDGCIKVVLKPGEKQTREAA
jgi:hypothetical protein